MIKDIKKKVGKLLEEKEALYKKIDEVGYKHREELIELLVAMFVNIMAKVRRGSPNGANITDLYLYKDNNNHTAFANLINLESVNLLKGGMSLQTLQSVILESEEYSRLTFRYSYVNVDGVEVFLNESEEDIDLSLLLHILENIALHPFFKQENFKYLKKLNEFKNR